MSADPLPPTFVESLDIGEDIAEQAMDDIDTLAAARAAALNDAIARVEGLRSQYPNAQTDWVDRPEVLAILHDLAGWSR